MWTAWALLVACTGDDVGHGTEPVAGEPTGDSAAAPYTLRVITWNTGTTLGLAHDASPDDGYTSEDAAASDAYYGDGLAWSPAVDAAAVWLTEVQPDVVVFQEMFFSDDCADIPEDAYRDFVCATWNLGDPTVAQHILGDGWQVACHVGKSDKCAAVHERVGRFAGCEASLCMDGLDGGEVPGCGSGSRIGRGTVVGAEAFTVVNVHGTSGLSLEDQQCRLAQVEQVFVDLGDGEPAANGARNLVLGDLNTDPGRLAGVDVSAARWLDFAGDGRGFAFHTEVGPDAPRSYGGVTDIDHVMTDFATGGCWIAGVSEGHDDVIDAVYFDHHPVVCDLAFMR